MAAMVPRRREAEGDALGAVPYRRSAAQRGEARGFDLLSLAADLWVALFFAAVVLTLMRWGDIVDAVATLVMGFAPRGG